MGVCPFCGGELSNTGVCLSCGYSRAQADALDEEVLEVLKRQPEKNPDGTLWKLVIGNRSFTKSDILRNWAKDGRLRSEVRKLLLGLKLHLLGRGPSE